MFWILWPASALAAFGAFYSFGMRKGRSSAFAVTSAILPAGVWAFAGFIFYRLDRDTGGMLQLIDAYGR